MEEDIIRSSVLYPQRERNRKKETEKVVCSSKNLENLDSELYRFVVFIFQFTIVLYQTAESSVA